MTRRAGGALAVLLSVGLGAIGAGCSQEYVAPPPATTSDAADGAAAATTLDALLAAVESADTDGARELGSTSTAADQLAAIVDNATALDLGDVSLRYLTETGRTSGADSWDANVAVTWRVDGFDDASSRGEVPVTFAEGGRRIAAVGGVTGRSPLWLSGPLAVRRGEDVVVMSARGEADADATLARAETAVGEVRTVLGETPGLVVEVPADGASLHRALGVDAGTYDSIAAITATVDGAQAPGTPVHVFVNPPVFDGLDRVAAQVVMTHEAVHALTGAALDRRAPLWLVEGFADHVALRDVDLPLSRTAGQVIEEVRRDGVPDQLPPDAAFGPAATHLGAAYEAAWQVCETLVAERDEATLTALYRAVLGGQDLASALRRLYGWSEDDLRRAWQDRLAALAG